MRSLIRVQVLQAENRCPASLLSRVIARVADRALRICRSVPARTAWLVCRSGLFGDSSGNRLTGIGAEKQLIRKGAGVRKKKTAAKAQESQAPAKTQVIHPIRDGEWVPGEEFQAEAVKLLDAGANIRADLEGIDYLDASSLQILLAIHAGQKAKNRGFSMTGLSPALHQWFRYAGVEQELPFD